MLTRRKPNRPGRLNPEMPTPDQAFQDSAFWLLAAVAIAAASGVVLVKDLFRSALLLAVVFVAVAGFFLLLSAEFLAVVQVLIYTGAVAVLFIFAVMLSPNVRESNRPNRLQVPAAALSALLLVVMAAAALLTDWQLIPEDRQSAAEMAQTQAVSNISEETLTGQGLNTEKERAEALEAGLADLLLGRYVLAFEAVSLLLLAALIGGLALAGKRGG